MAAKSHKLGPGSLKFGATGSEVEFSTRCRAAQIKPESKAEDPLPVLSGDELDGDTTDSYTVEGKIFQDYDLDSLLTWAHLNRGKIVDFLFIPDKDRALGVKGRVKVSRIGIGGEVKARNESDFSFLGIGDYDLVDVTTGQPVVINAFTDVEDSTTPVDGGEPWA